MSLSYTQVSVFSTDRVQQLTLVPFANRFQAKCMRAGTTHRIFQLWRQNAGLQCADFTCVAASGVNFKGSVGVKKYMVGAVPSVEYFGLLLLLQRSQKVMDEDAMGAV
jgi:hypothetical protein